MFIFGILCVSPEGTFDHTRVVYTEPSRGTWFCPLAGCSCICHTLLPMYFLLGEPHRPPRKPADRILKNWVSLHHKKGGKIIAPYIQTHFVWQAGCFCAAAVIGTGGCDETSSAGLGKILAVAHTFKHIAALCLFD